MRRISIVLLVLKLLCQTIFSQDHQRNMVRSIGWMEADHFGATLSRRDAGESFKTHLKIPSDYEFRNQIITPGSKNPTRETDDQGYVHERYDQFYKGIRIEHSDIRARYLNDKLVSINGEYICIPDIDISVVLSQETAIQKPKNILVQKNISGKTKVHAYF